MTEKRNNGTKKGSETDKKCFNNAAKELKPRNLENSSISIVPGKLSSVGSELLLTWES